MCSAIDHPAHLAVSDTPCPKTMDEALNQLFGYLVWRDTKAAILLFVRNKDVTAVVDKAIDKIKKHPNHKRSNANTASSAEEYDPVTATCRQEAIRLAKRIVTLDGELVDNRKALDVLVA